LRQEVESLIALHNSSDHLLDHSVGGVAARLLAGAPAPPLIGQRLAAYQIERLLGRGGMGEVYLARDTRLGRPVAIKLLPSLFHQDPNRVRRFQQEARAASSLNHPNIVTIHEVGETDGQRFIVSEFINGKTLCEMMKAGGVALAQALDIIIQTAGALSAAHQAGIVHRDIKPENLMVRPDGYVKVLDFGLAKLTERAQGLGGIRPDEAADDLSRLSTQAGALLGTFKYMSSEQARGQPVDARTDVFSLGVVFYEMVAGRGPFDGETASDVVA
jgi:serine/threonine protein kinase